MSRCPECGMEPLACECAVADSDCIDVKNSGMPGRPLTFSPKLDPDPGNLLFCSESGLDLQTAQLLDRPAVHITNTVDQTIVPDFVNLWTPISYNSVRYDTDGMASLGDNSIIIQTPGVYTVTCLVQWTPYDYIQYLVVFAGNTMISLDQTPAGSSLTTKQNDVVITREFQVGERLQTRVFAEVTLDIVTRRWSPNFAAVWERGPT